jgi:hypothetical protein
MTRDACRRAHVYVLVIGERENSCITRNVARALMSDEFVM